ncbi:hypothetical protein GUJ93_ZPchr0006g45325 [Zizania palustris]|uniref:Uncharacterized protein n=1 Tax=Zizania palustris TaxID=103762 RepID=A0A8J5QY46_ZIZPA|nr:hypothetical protein GUJ93_ZPchr0008g12359 [Zizania palustris]KAG8069481.1 hypothetical protein GUJ93_ZPchr0006g45325 [Zizania palustris]
MQSILKAQHQLSTDTSKHRLAAAALPDHRAILSLLRRHLSLHSSINIISLEQRQRCKQERQAFPLVRLPKEIERTIEVIAVISEKIFAGFAQV